MNHKYGKPRSSRAGCKLCKPQKKNRYCAHRYAAKAEEIQRINDVENIELLDREDPMVDTIEED